jgi:hypothetical protein
LQRGRGSETEEGGRIGMFSDGGAVLEIITDHKLFRNKKEKQAEK